MMDERDLDRAIDAAAEAMMAREPSRAIGYTVMAHVRESKASAPRRVVWVTAAASLVMCGAIAIAVTSRALVTVAPLPPAAQLAVGQPAVLPAAVAVTAETPTPLAAPKLGTILRAKAGRFLPTARSASRVGSTLPLPPDDVSEIEPIQTEPIVLSALELPQLEREATSIDSLRIEPLTIEPLAASND